MPDPTELIPLSVRFPFAHLLPKFTTAFLAMSASERDAWYTNASDRDLEDLYLGSRDEHLFVHNVVLTELHQEVVRRRLQHGDDAFSAAIRAREAESDQTRAEDRDTHPFTGSMLDVPSIARIDAEVVALKELQEQARREEVAASERVERGLKYVDGMLKRARALVPAKRLDDFDAIISSGIYAEAVR